MVHIPKVGYAAFQSVIFNAAGVATASKVHIHTALILFNYIVVDDFKHAPLYDAVWGNNGIALRVCNFCTR